MDKLTGAYKPAGDNSALVAGGNMTKSSVSAKR
jgi:hypothetical protein